MTTAVTLSIVIVNWNTRELLAQCLQSVYDTADDLEVIIVDNASTDGSAALVRDRFHQVQLIENVENKGFVQANNQALDLYTGRYLLLLNSDTIVLPGAIAHMVEFMEAHPQFGALGAELRNSDGSLQASWAQFPSLLSELSGRNFRVRQPYSNGKAYIVDWVGGACLMVRREVVEKVGGLDANIFMYSEETDWCYRIAQAGWQIGYLPGARVIHLGGASSSKQDIRMLTTLYESKLYFFRKHYGARRMQVLKFGLLLLTLLKMAVLFPRRLASAGQHTSFKRQRALFQALRKVTV